MLSHLHNFNGVKPSTECKADSESKEHLESSSIDSESKQLTESTTPKNPNEALPDLNNSACASTSRFLRKNKAIHRI